MVLFFLFIIVYSTIPDHDMSIYISILTASTDGLPQSRQAEASRSRSLSSHAGPFFPLFCNRWVCRPPDVCCSEKTEKRLATPLVGEQCVDGSELLPASKVFWSSDLRR